MFKAIIENYRNGGFLHHAYLILGDREAIQPILTDTLKIVGDGATIIWENYETFGIDESRGLTERSARRNWHGKRELVVINAERYTIEAQNALLKLFEEPRVGLHFFILSARATDFLPTLQSRLIIIENREDIKSEKHEQDQKALEFLSSTPADRLDFIAKELKRELTRAEWSPFLNALEKICHNQPTLNEKALTELGLVRHYLADPASSPRLLFEHLAFVLPRTSHH